MENAYKINIDRKWLIRIYLIIPLLILITAIDIMFFHSSLLPYMGITSLLFPLYLLFFELPHIIGSFFGFFDKDYVVYYRKYFTLWIPLFLFFMAILMYINFSLVMLIYIIGTMYHVIRQQTGITFFFGVKPSNLHKVWSWLGIIVTSFIYILLVFPNFFIVPKNITDTVALILISTFAICGIVYMKLSPNKQSKLYIAITTFMLICSYILIGINYIFFGFFIMRFVHDITAFYFYITHDVNRNEVSAQNYIYKFLKFLPIPVLVLVPLLSVSISAGLRQIPLGTKALFILIITLGFLHYILESVMWKRDSMHRKQIWVV